MNFSSNRTNRTEKQHCAHLILFSVLHSTLFQNVQCEHVWAFNRAAIENCINSNDIYIYIDNGGDDNVETKTKQTYLFDSLHLFDIWPKFYDKIATRTVSKIEIVIGAEIIEWNSVWIVYISTCNTSLALFVSFVECVGVCVSVCTPLLARILCKLTINDTRFRTGIIRASAMDTIKSIVGCNGILLRTFPISHSIFRE